MHLKTFEGPTLDDALRRVRAAFGKDALIVSTEAARKGGPVRVTAACERRNDAADAPAAPANGVPVDDPLPLLRHGLADSGIDGNLAAILLAAAHYVATPVAPAVALAAAFDSAFRFRPLTTGDGAGLVADRDRRRLMLVGPPGAGKTVTVAKLAARAQLSDASVRAITVDTRKTGGAAHLEALAAHLTIGAAVAESPDELAALAGGSRSDLTVIDSFGANPFDDADMADLAACIRAARAEPVLVLPAGVEALDARDIVAAFATLGCRRAIVTRVDLTRRLGSLLGAFHAGGIDFCDVSVAPDILPPEHGGLRALNPVALARLVLPDPRIEMPAAAAPPAAGSSPAESTEATTRRPARSSVSAPGRSSRSAPKPWILAS